MTTQTVSEKTYTARRGEIEHYFDRTAMEAWKKLTSDAPVSGIRATVRAGRDRMRATLLDWLPADLTGKRVLDAGCGTGALALEAARRGAQVVAIDLSPRLVQLAEERAPTALLKGSHAGAGYVDFRVGDMADAGLGRFDHVIAMDSLIHYRTTDLVKVLAHMAGRVDGSFVITFAPRTPALAVMHAVGKLFPRGDRAPSIVPAKPERVFELVRIDPALKGFAVGRTLRVASGFYTSQALEIHRIPGDVA